MKEISDIFITKEFKELRWTQRVWIRIKVAFIELIQYGF
jgi:hypothetical protein